MAVTPGWIDDFGAALDAGDRKAALAVLDSRATAHAGTANAADKRAAARELLRRCADAPAEVLVGWPRWLARQDNPTARGLAALLITSIYPVQREEAVAILQGLCDDANWEVREWGGSTAGELLTHHFDEFCPILERWIAHPSPSVRRAVALAARGAADRRHPERAGRLFDLIEPLLPDRAEYVRRNLGPFAVASLLARYPEQTIARIRQWARSDDETVRWNAAMAFAAAPAGRHVAEALEILSELARDERRLVRRAVSAALRNLLKRDPDHVTPVLRSWLGDDRQPPAALASAVRAGARRRRPPLRP